MTKPREIGRCFKDDVVRAILDGRQTQDRRPLKPQPPPGAWPIYDTLDCYEGEGWAFQYPEKVSEDITFNRIFELPNRGQLPLRIGDSVYVRETVWVSDCGEYYARRNENDVYEVFSEEACWPWPDYKSEYASPRTTTAFSSMIKGFKLSFSDNDAEIKIIPGTGNTILKRYSAVFSKRIPSIYMPKKLARLWLRVTDVRVQRVQEISGNDARAEGVSGALEFSKLWNSIYAAPRPMRKGGEIVSYQCWPWSLRDFVKTTWPGTVADFIGRWEEGAASLTIWKGKPLHVNDNPWVVAATLEREER